MILIVFAVPVVLFSEQRQDQIRALVDREWNDEQKPFAAVIIVGLFAADILLPVPATAVCAVAGRIFGIVVGTLLCWIGLNLSALIGYLIACFAGWPAIRKFSNETDVELIKNQIDRWGIWPLVALRPVPVLSEASILLMGAYRYSAAKFWPAIISSNFVVAATFVGMGSWFAESGQFWIGFAISCLLPVAMLAVWICCFKK